MTRNTHTTLNEQLGDLIGDKSRVSTTAEVIAAHSHDAWPVAVKERQAGEQNHAPDIVVLATSTQEVSRVLAFANANRVPVTAWGRGSSVVGAPLAEAGGICLDTSKMNALVHIDARNSTVTAQAGIVGGYLEELLNREGLTMNFSPQSLHRSSIGGWVATRATGQFSSRYGGIEDALVAIEAVLADGTVINTLKLPRMSVGPDINNIFLGSEGCFGVVTQVTLRIYPKPETRLFKTIDFPDVKSGVNAMRAFMTTGLKPFLLRFYDLQEARFAMHDAAYPNPVMFLGTDGLSDMAAAEMAACVRAAEAHGGAVVDNGGTEAWMSRRFDFSKIEDVLGEAGGVAETIEISSDWDGILKTHAILKERLGHVSQHVLGHFSHAYVNGVSLYMILVGEEADLEASRARIDEIWRISMEGALETGASIAHHHGAGMARSRYVRRSLGRAHDVLMRLKASLDPNGILNPGKLGLGW